MFVFPLSWTWTLGGQSPYFSLVLYSQHLAKVPDGWFFTNGLLNAWINSWIWSHLVLFPVLPQVQKLMRKKQLDVAEFSIYWDVDCTLLGDLPHLELQVWFWQRALSQHYTDVKWCKVTVIEVFVLCVSDSCAHPPSIGTHVCCLRYLLRM